MDAQQTVQILERQVSVDLKLYQVLSVLRRAKLRGPRDSSSGNVDRKRRKFPLIRAGCQHGGGNERHANQDDNS